MVRLNSMISIVTEYYDGVKKELKTLLPRLGSNIKFDDDTWFCDKQKKSAGIDNARYTWQFTKIPEKYRDIVKYFCLNSSDDYNAPMK